MSAVKILVILLVLAAGYYFFSGNTKETYYNEVHIHADFAVYLDGDRLDLSADDYQSGDEVARHAFLHLHENMDDVLHIHGKYQTFSEFLGSLGMVLGDSCFTRRGKEWCREDGLRLFVNDREYTKPFATYTPRDLDRVLLTNTPDGETLESEKASVTDRACIQSGICPERGEALEGCSVAGDCPAPPAIEPLSVGY